jgi:hypothetical protein
MYFYKKSFKNLKFSIFNSIIVKSKLFLNNRLNFLYKNLTINNKFFQKINKNYLKSFYLFSENNKKRRRIFRLKSNLKKPNLHYGFFNKTSKFTFSKFIKFENSVINSYLLANKIFIYFYFIFFNINSFNKKIKKFNNNNFIFIIFNKNKNFNFISVSYLYFFSLYEKIIFSINDSLSFLFYTIKNYIIKQKLQKIFVFF